MDDFDDGDYMEMDGFEWLYVEDDFELAVRVSVQRIPLSAVGVLPSVPFSWESHANESVEPCPNLC